MATFNYNKFLNLANRLIKKFGGTFVYKVNVTGTYNPATRTQSGGVSTKSVKAVILRPGQALSEGSVKGFMPGTGTEKDQLQALIDPKGLTFTPRQGDTMTAESVVFFVQSVKPINPSGSKVVLYIATLKAGA